MKQKETFSNELITNYDFDELSRPVSIAHSLDQGAISQFDYSYSDNGNITQIVEAIAGIQNGNAAKTHSYNYDILNRLTQANSYKNETFGMDLLGNIINQNQIYNNLNQMTEDQNRFYNYDQRGNLVLITNKIGPKKTELNFNKQNQLTLLKIKEDGVSPSITISYKYDGLRRRIERAVTNHVDPTKSYLRKFIYDQEDILAELDENNNYVAGYLHGPGIDNVIAMVRDVNGNHRFEDDEVFYFTKDHLGSVREITDRNGKVIQRYYYSAYGETKVEKVNPTSNHKTLENRYGFTGRELELETGFYDYRERTYIPFMKMFAQPDPIGLDSGDLNRQRYVKNSPIMSIDPLGLITKDSFVFVDTAERSLLTLKRSIQWAALVAAKAKNKLCGGKFASEVSKAQSQYNITTSKISDHDRCSSFKASKDYACKAWGTQSSQCEQGEKDVAANCPG